MYLTHPLEKIWAIDIEGNPIPSTKVWCAVLINARTKQVERYRPDDLKSLAVRIAKLKSEGCKFVGHNIIGYDAPTLNRILGTSLNISDIIDSMLTGMVYNPSLEGGHSLKAWGIRLKDKKIDFEDFSKFSEEQLVYCEQDTSLCLKVYLTLRSKMLKMGFTDKGLEIEHRAWALKERQSKTGFAFNIEEAHVLFSKLRSLQQEIEDQAYSEYWKPEFRVVAEYKRPFKKDGSPSVNYTRHCEQYPKVELNAEQDGYACYDYVYFDIGSPQQRVEQLLKLGWKPGPRERTKTGNPQPTKKGKLAPTLERFVQESGKEQVRLIVEWMNVNYLGNMVNTWINAYNESTGAIHGKLFLANTMRYKHSDPNTANIPAVKIGSDGHPLKGEEGGYTYEARGLWVCRDPKRRSLVGVDAKGIQLRILAHYLNNPNFTAAILSADPHSENQKNMGLPSRALTKTITYATLMGAGDGRIAEEARVSLEEAKEAKQKFFEQVPELPGLIDRLTYEWRKTGRITLCSGTKIIVPRDYTVIPYLLQGDESQIMKQAAIFAAGEIKRRKLDVLKVGDIHDEWQNDVLNEHVDPFRFEVCPSAFKAAGEVFDYNLPIECDAKVGKNWAETH